MVAIGGQVATTEGVELPDVRITDMTVSSSWISRRQMETEEAARGSATANYSQRAGHEIQAINTYALLVIR